MKSLFEKIQGDFSFKGRLNKNEFYSSYLYGLIDLVLLTHIILPTFYFFIFFLFTALSYSLYDVSLSVVKFLNFFNKPIGFLVFSYFLLAICRKRSRDMNSDALLSIVFFVPLNIFTFFLINFTSILKFLFPGWNLNFLPPYCYGIFCN